MTLLWVGWASFLAVFAGGHWRTRRDRGGGPARENRVLRDRSSDLGMALQTVGLAIAFAGGEPRSNLLPYALAVAASAILFTGWALRWLGRQWRIAAVVTDDHELITGGPYAVVRHPIYLGLLGMLGATLLVHTAFFLIAPSLLIYLAGTQIRVRAEDKILAAAFRGRFSRYKARVRAYIPLPR